MNKIVLAGNPNVGKSAIFSRLTGARVVSANYPGTTISLLQGKLKLEDKSFMVVDAPGVYDLSSVSEAEQIASRIISEGDVIVNVIDATNLERNLYLTLQLLELNKPVIVILNFWDETHHRGVQIDVDALAEHLGVPVIPTVGITGEGIKDLIGNIRTIKTPDTQKRPVVDKENLWSTIGDIIEKTQSLKNRRHTFLDRLHDFSLHSFGGLILALLVLFLSFITIRFVSEGLIENVLEPLFYTYYAPFMENLINRYSLPHFLQYVLVGELVEGAIDFELSFGLLTTGLFIPIGVVLPYIFSFYLVLGFLEDSGYLPRLAIFLDNIMHKINLHGWAIIPVLLGMGCNVPGVLATRILDSPKQRFIAAVSISIAVPCVALQAMIIGLVGKQSPLGVVFIYSTLFILWIFMSKILGYVYTGDNPELILEIPPYRVPSLMLLLKKTFNRLLDFLREGMPLIFIGVLMVNLLYFFDLLSAAGRIFGPFLSFILGLPPESIVGLLIGFLKKELAIGFLAVLELDIKQLIVACLFLAMSFPCIATFLILWKELRWKYFIIAVIIMLVVALTVGFAANMLLQWIPESVLLAS